MKINSSATEPLKLKNLLAGVKVACNFFLKGNEVARMMSNVLQKANECLNATVDDQAEAVKLLHRKHRRLAFTSFDPNGKVCEMLEDANLRNIDDYKRKTSAITGRLETASFTIDEMGSHTLRRAQEEENPRIDQDHSRKRIRDEEDDHSQDRYNKKNETNYNRTDQPKNLKPPHQKYNHQQQPMTDDPPPETPEECFKCGSYTHKPK